MLSQVKCAQYWPDRERVPQNYGEVEVKLMEQITLTSHTVRDFLITNVIIHTIIVFFISAFICIFQFICIQLYHRILSRGSHPSLFDNCIIQNGQILAAQRMLKCSSILFTRFEIKPVPSVQTPILFVQCLTVRYLSIAGQYNFPYT